MILLFFHFFFSCLSTNQRPQPEIFQEELKKIDELEKKLNQTLDLLFDYVQKKEQSITANKGKDFENQLGDLINRTQQIMNNSKSYTTLAHIPLTMEKIDCRPANSQLNLTYPGFIVPGDYPTITYKPVTKMGNHPKGVYFYNITKNTCEASELAFTFYNNATVSPSQTFYLNQNIHNITYNINDIDNFDMLEVTVNAKVGSSSQTCIPYFILFSNDEDN